MEEPGNLQDWEVLSDSDSNSQIAFEEIIHADYFSLDSTKLHPKYQGLEEIEFPEKKMMVFRPKNRNFDSDCELGVGDINEGGSYLEDGSKMEVGLEGSETKNQNSCMIDAEDESGVGEINKGVSFIVEDPKTEGCIEGNEMKVQNSFVIDSKHELGVAEINKGGSFPPDDSKMEVDIEDIANGDSFDGDDSSIDVGFEKTESENKNSYAIDCKHEFGTRERKKGDSFLQDDSKMQVRIEGFTNEDFLNEDDSKIDLGFKGTELQHENSYAIDSKHELGIQKIHGGGSLLVDDSEGEVGIEEIDRNNQNPQEFGSDSSIKISNSESVSVNDGKKKVFVWWKLPLDMIKLFASKVRPVWSISIAVAVIGILIVRRKLNQMKHKSRRIPLKISFEDKKAASQLLIRAARLSEVIVRRVPVVRSPLLPTSGGVTPWSAPGHF